MNPVLIGRGMGCARTGGSPNGPLPRHWGSVTLCAGLMVVVAGCDVASPPAVQPAAAPIQTRKTLGQTTQNVLELSAALADGGVLAATSVTSGDMTAITDAARTSAGKIGSLAVQQKMRLYEAEHGRRPRNYAEFMAQIIAAGTPDSVSLPMLPYYQEWAFDAETGAVVVVEFPAKKAQRQEETTGAAGL
jgi:hypothetical protein